MNPLATRFPLGQIKLAVGMFFAIAAGCDPVYATDEHVTGALTVDGEADIHGNTFNLGSWVYNSNQLGLSTVYAEDAASNATLTLTANRPVSNWLWQEISANGPGVVRQMMLSSNNVLTLYNKATPQTSAIVLDPTGTSTFGSNTVFSGTSNRMPNQTYVDSSTVLTAGLADARYLVQSVNNQLAVGLGANAGGDSAVALGSNANASNYGSTALGSSASALDINQLR